MDVSLTPGQIHTMLRLQCGMNAKVDPNWVGAAYPYLRAVLIEAAEAMEHHGWKWWKRQVCDLPQLQMELVDIWHFLLSQILLRNDGDPQKAAAVLQQLLQDDNRDYIKCDGQSFDITNMNLLEKLELLIVLSGLRRMELGLFDAILKDCEMSWNELHRQYVGKNVLNFFRQDHGYKQGSYQKLWGGREDNEHLVELMLALPQDSENYPEQLYQALQQRYLDACSP